jgi:hypothetical protein
MNAVQVYCRSEERGGGHVAAIHLAGLHGEIVADTAEAARDAARYLRALARVREAEQPVMPPGEFDAARHVHGVLHGEGKT